MSLNDVLLDALSSLPGARSLSLYTFCGSPTRDPELFVYSRSRPKVHVRHILVLLVQHPPEEPDARVCVCAIEAFLYTIPSTSSAILYISKVDSTGQANVRPNPTTALVIAFLQYYASKDSRPAPNFWIQVFARAQNQYLFPNSAEYSGKRVLRDVQLCKWWKAVIESAAKKSADSSLVRLYYLFPGFSSFEATSILNQSANSNSPDYHWSYSHPYHQTDIPPPTGGDVAQDSPLSISQLIPSFPDDPKARFLDEIATTPSEELTSIPRAAPPSPRAPKRIKLASESTSDETASSSSSNTKSSNTHTNTRTIPPSAHRALNNVPTDEFWERMAFRQECSQAAMTGFFTALFIPPSPTSTIPKPSSSTSQSSGTAVNQQRSSEVPIAILQRLLGTLMNLDFSTTERARRATRVIEDAIKALCKGINDSEESSSGVIAETSTSKPPLADSDSSKHSIPATPPVIVPNEKGPDTLETTLMSAPVLLDRSIYGSRTLNNMPLPEASMPGGASGEAGVGPTPPVTILQVRKKKRPATSVPNE